MRGPIVIAILQSLLCRGESVRALENFYIQPIIDLSSGRVCSGEIQALDEDPDLNISVTQDSFVLALRALDRMQAKVGLSVNLSCQYICSGKMFPGRYPKRLAISTPCSTG
ncbi:MAG: hypothetical protein NTZ23_12490 [Cyanobium sp. LacPavin_0920_WC12_MAG_63_22]|nr:hypothetical protein [Cyanobium sp. LacPavin_0920_WC12_MAG_63_22]